MSIRRAVAHAAELLPERLRDEAHHHLIVLDAPDLHAMKERRRDARRQLDPCLCLLRHGAMVDQRLASAIEMSSPVAVRRDCRPCKVRRYAGSTMARGTNEGENDALVPVLETVMGRRSARRLESE